MRRKPVLLTAAGVVVALLIAGEITFAEINGNRTPEQAVRDYVSHIANGDPDGAAALVDPRHATGGDLNAARLATGLRSATRHITIDFIESEWSADDDRDPVPVRVDYSLPGQHGEATLRVHRESTAAGLLTRWRVLDPLLVPVTVQTDVPALRTARLGATDVPTSGPKDEGYPQHPVLVYPATYTLRGQPSKYLTAQQLQLAAVPPTDPLEQYIQLWYEPTTALRQRVLHDTVDYLHSCVSTTPMPRNCPRDLSLLADFGHDFTITDQPQLDTFVAQQSKPRPGHPEGSPFGFMTHPIGFTYVNSTGKPDSDDLLIFGDVDIRDANTATVTFDSRP